MILQVGSATRVYHSFLAEFAQSGFLAFFHTAAIVLDGVIIAEASSLFALAL